MKKPLAVIVLRRKLGALQTGANVYLSVLLSELRDAGFRVNFVFAPDSSFGNLPVATFGQSFEMLCDDLFWPRTVRIGRYFFSLSHKAYVRFFRRVWQELYHRLSRREQKPRIGQVSEPLSASEVEEIAVIVNSLAPDLAIVEYSALGPVLEKIATPTTIRGIFLHDLFSLRAQAMRDQNRPVDFADITIEEEASLCRSADVLVYASQTERDVFQQFLPNCTHVWLAPHRETKPEVPPSGHPKALFIGVRHSGNLDAIGFLMEEIWPQVIEQKPDAELWIVGEIGLHLRPEWSKKTGVKVLGFVDDLVPLGGPDTVGLAPTRVASGISIKFVDYMNLGMAILASDIAIGGYGGALRKIIKTADSAEEFATRLVQLLNDQEQRHALAQKIRQDGLRLLENGEFQTVLGKKMGREESV